MPSNDKPVPRILQQQPERDSDPDQQQSGSSDFQPKAAAGKGDKQMGEGSYEATRDYQKDIEEYLKRADIDADAIAAKPRSQQEARELDEAEKEGRSHSKGEH
ncbi:MAG TPA: hypothetical protein VN663_18825 [Ramlibacter sp.]|nr:hypothetical protein [Ramlibacter sp.]